MGLTGWPVIGGSVLLTVLVAGYAVWTWNRPRLRVTRRLSALLGCQLLVLTSLGLVFNRQNSIYTSWNDLFGGNRGRVFTGVEAARMLHLPPGLLAPPARDRTVGGDEPGGQPGNRPGDRPSDRPSDTVSPRLGGDRPVPGQLPGPGDRSAGWDRRLGHDWHGHHRDHHSMVVAVSITGRTTGYDLPGRLYLPAAYFRHSYALARFPVIEFLDGFPGGPQNWLGFMHVQRLLDAEIAAGRLPPVIGVFPTQNLNPLRDTECVDAVHGTRADTYLSTDVPAWVQSRLRVRTDRDGWALMGYSTGGYCAVNLALRHPQRFSTAVSLSGYFTPLTDRTTGDLYKGRTAVMLSNDPRWLVRHSKLPAMHLFFGASMGDTAAVKAVNEFIPKLPPSLERQVALLPDGGHNPEVWRILQPACYGWLGTHLAVLGGPATPPPPTPNRAATASPHDTTKAAPA